MSPPAIVTELDEQPQNDLECIASREQQDVNNEDDCLMETLNDCLVHDDPCAQTLELQQQQEQEDKNNEQPNNFDMNRNIKNELELTNKNRNMQTIEIETEDEDEDEDESGNALNGPSLSSNGHLAIPEIIEVLKNLAACKEKLFKWEQSVSNLESIPDTDPNKNNLMEIIDFVENTRSSTKEKAIYLYEQLGHKCSQHKNYIGAAKAFERAASLRLDVSDLNENGDNKETIVSSTIRYLELAIHNYDAIHKFKHAGTLHYRCSRILKMMNASHEEVDRHHEKALEYFTKPDHELKHRKRIDGVKISCYSSYNTLQRMHHEIEKFTHTTTTTTTNTIKFHADGCYRDSDDSDSNHSITPPPSSNGSIGSMTPPVIPFYGDTSGHDFRRHHNANNFFDSYMPETSNFYENSGTNQNQATVDSSRESNQTIESSAATATAATASVTESVNTVGKTAIMEKSTTLKSTNSSGGSSRLHHHQSHHHNHHHHNHHQQQQHHHHHHHHESMSGVKDHHHYHHHVAKSSHHRHLQSASSSSSYSYQKSHHKSSLSSVGSVVPGLSTSISPLSALHAHSSSSSSSNGSVNCSLPKPTFRCIEDRIESARKLVKKLNKLCPFYEVSTNGDDAGRVYCRICDRYLGAVSSTLKNHVNTQEHRQAYEDSHQQQGSSTSTTTSTTSITSQTIPALPAPPPAQPSTTSICTTIVPSSYSNNNGLTTIASSSSTRENIMATSYPDSLGVTNGTASLSKQSTAASINYVSADKQQQSQQPQQLILQAGLPQFLIQSNGITYQPNATAIPSTLQDAKNNSHHQSMTNKYIDFEMSGNANVPNESLTMSNGGGWLQSSRGTTDQVYGGNESQQRTSSASQQQYLYNGNGVSVTNNNANMPMENMLTFTDVSGVNSPMSIINGSAPNSATKQAMAASPVLMPSNLNHQHGHLSHHQTNFTMPSSITTINGSNVSTSLGSNNLINNGTRKPNMPLLAYQ